MAKELKNLIDKDIDIFESLLVPKHEILPLQEKQKLLKKYNITQKQLPKILESDPAAKAINAKTGDIIKITRSNPIAGISYYYRLVV